MEAIKIVKKLSLFILIILLIPTALFLGISFYFSRKSDKCTSCDGSETKCSRCKRSWFQGRNWAILVLSITAIFTGSFAIFMKQRKDIISGYEETYDAKKLGSRSRVQGFFSGQFKDHPSDPKNTFCVNYLSKAKKFVAAVPSNVTVGAAFVPHNPNFNITKSNLPESKQIEEPKIQNIESSPSENKKFHDEKVVNSDPLSANTPKSEDIPVNMIAKTTKKQRIDNSIVLTEPIRYNFDQEPKLRVKILDNQQILDAPNPPAKIATESSSLPPKKREVTFAQHPNRIDLNVQQPTMTTTDERERANPQPVSRTSGKSIMKRLSTRSQRQEQIPKHEEVKIMSEVDRQNQKELDKLIEGKAERKELMIKVIDEYKKQGFTNDIIHLLLLDDLDRNIKEKQKLRYMYSDEQWNNFVREEYELLDYLDKYKNRQQHSQPKDQEEVKKGLNYGLFRRNTTRGQAGEEQLVT